MAKFIGPTWGPPGSRRPQMGPILAPSTFLSGMIWSKNDCQTQPWNAVTERSEHTPYFTVKWLRYCHQVHLIVNVSPDSKVHGANIEPIWGRQDPGGPHVGPMNFGVWVCLIYCKDERFHKTQITFHCINISHVLPFISDQEQGYVKLCVILMNLNKFPLQLHSWMSHTWVVKYRKRNLSSAWQHPHGIWCRKKWIYNSCFIKHPR